MKKCPPERMLLRLAENELDEREASFVTNHILKCERCRRLLAEYRETLLMLAKERVPELDPAEWQRLMVMVRVMARAKARRGKKSVLTERLTGRLGQKRQAWPAWSRVTAIAATAALALLVLWNTGVIDLDRLAGGIRHTIGRDENEKAISGGEKYASSGKTSPIGEGRLDQGQAGEGRSGEDATEAGKESPSDDAGRLLSDKAFLESDSTFLGLAGLTGEELYELSEISASGSALGEYDLMLVELTDEEQAELLKELESSSSM